MSFIKYYGGCIYAKVTPKELQINNPSPTPDPLLGLYDIPAGIYAFGEYNNQGNVIEGGIVEVYKEGHRNYAVPVMLAIEPFDYFVAPVYNKDGSIVLNPNHIELFDNPNALVEEYAAMFDDMLRTSMISITGDVYDFGGIEMANAATIFTSVNRIKEDLSYIFDVSCLDFPSFNGYLAINIPDLVNPNTQNWIFKTTEDVNHNVVLLVLGNENVLYAYNDGQITEVQRTQEIELNQVLAFVQDVFATIYGGHIIHEAGGSITNIEELLDEVPDRVLWTVTG